MCRKAGGPRENVPGSNLPFGAGIALPPSDSSHCTGGVVHAALDAESLSAPTISLQALLATVSAAWQISPQASECVAIAFPTIYEVADGKYAYSQLEVQNVDAELELSKGSARKYRLRAYCEHVHYGQPSRCSRVGGHYVTHFRNGTLW